RFNSQVNQVDKRWFIGLASPASAGLLASLVWTCFVLGTEGAQLRYLALAATATAALLMVSRVRYFSFKGSGPRSDRMPFLTVVVVLAELAATAIDPPRVLLAITGVYALTGPVHAAWRRSRRGEAGRAATWVPGTGNSAGGCGRWGICWCRWQAKRRPPRSDMGCRPRR